MELSPDSVCNQAVAQNGSPVTGSFKDTVNKIGGRGLSIGAGYTDHFHLAAWKTVIACCRRREGQAGIVHRNDGDPFSSMPTGREITRPHTPANRLAA